MIFTSPILTLPGEILDESLFSGITASGCPPSPTIATVGLLTRPPSAMAGAWLRKPRSTAVNSTRMGGAS